jgi:hypothetical protein
VLRFGILSTSQTLLLNMQMPMSAVPASSAVQDVRPNEELPPVVRIDNPMPHRLPEGENATPLEVIGTTASDKLIIIMVGLPATGKSERRRRRRRRRDREGKNLTHCYPFLSSLSSYNCLFHSLFGYFK